jgi:hypothetical protein
MVLMHSSSRSICSDTDVLAGGRRICEQTHFADRRKPGGRKIAIASEQTGQHFVLFRTGDQKGCSPTAFQGRVGQRDAGLQLAVENGRYPLVTFAQNSGSGKQ